MGAVESRHTSSYDVTNPQKYGKPLPATPSESESDMDSPPSYAPPPPPGDQSKRSSWHIKGHKGSWSVQPNEGGRKALLLDSESRNIVTVKVVDAPEIHDLKLEAPLFQTNQNIDGSWTLKNMQYVMSNELKHSSKENIQNPNLPDLVRTEKISYKLKSSKDDINASANSTLKRMEDIRIDFPEGNAKEVDHYNKFQYIDEQLAEKDSVDASVRLSAEAPKRGLKESEKGLPKSNKSKLNTSCFGKRKSLSDSFEDITAQPKEHKKETVNIQNKPPNHTISKDKKIKRSEFSPERKKVKLTSCFRKPKSTGNEKSGSSSNADISEVDVKSKLELEANESMHKASELPKTDAKLETSKIEGEIQLEAPAIDAKIRAPSVEAELSPQKIEIKKKPSSLGSCFGKKDKKIGAKIGTPKIEGEVQLEKPDIEAKVETPSIEAGVASPKLKSKKKSSNLGSCFGKKDKKIEAKMETPELTGEVQVKTPDKETTRETISAEVDASPPKIKSKKKGSNLGSCFGKEDKKIEAKIDTPKIEGEAQLVKPDIEATVDTSSIEAGVSAPELKSKKKSSSLGSCFGKKNKDAKMEFPKLEGEVQVEAPAVEAPSVEAELSPPGTKTKKKSSNLGSCFGKTDKKNDAKMQTPKLEGGVQLESPDIESTVETPSIEAEVSAPELKSKKKPSKLGSCFGKKDKKIDAKTEAPKVEGEAKLEAPEIEAIVKTPSLKAEASAPKLKSKKKSSNLGSCFGKKDKKIDAKIESPKLEVETPGIEATVKVPSYIGIESKSEIELKNPAYKYSLEGSELPELGEIELQIPDVNLKTAPVMAEVQGKANTKVELVHVEQEHNFGLTKLEIKSETSSIDVNAPFVELKAPSIEIETPTLTQKLPSLQIGEPLVEEPPSVEIQSPAVEIQSPYVVQAPSVEVETSTIEVAAPPAEGSVSLTKMKPKKKSVKLGSCFGKKEKNIKSEIQLPKVEGKVELERTEIELKSDSPAVKADVPSAEIEISAPKTSTKMKSANLGSCFGKKDKGKTEIKAPEFKTKGELEELDIEVQTGVPSIETEVQSAEVQASAPKLKSKNKSAGIGSCFGKKDKKIKADKDSRKVSKIALQGPDIEVEGNTSSVEVEAPSSEVEIYPPKVKSKKKSAGLGSCFGKKDKKAKAKIDTTEFEDKRGLQAPDLEVGVDPSVEAEISSAGVKISAPEANSKNKSVGLGSCFGKKDRKANINTPEVEGERKQGVELGVRVDAPSVESGIPSVEAKVSPPKVESKKKSTGVGSCFGKKDKKVKAKLNTPEVEGKVELEASDIDIRSDAPSVEGHVLSSEFKTVAPKLKSKNKSANSTSCFGKKGKKSRAKSDVMKSEGKLELEGPELEVKADVPSVVAEHPAAEVEVPALKLKSKKKSAGLGSCFGKKDKKIEAEVQTKKDEDKDEPERFDIEFRADAPNLEMRTDAPKLEAEIVSGETELKKPGIKVEADEPALQTEAPSAKVEVTAPKIKSKKKSAGLGSCFGKKNKKITSKRGVSKTKGKMVELEGPEIEIGTDVSDIKYMADTPHIDVEAEMPSGEISTPKIKSKKKSVGLGSCFGKKDKKFEAKKDVPKVQGEIEEPGVDKTDLSDVDIQTDNRSAEANVSVPKIKSKTKSRGLGSCFGKKEKKAKAEIAIPNNEGDAELGSPVIEVRADTASAEVVVPSIEAEVPSIKAEVPSLEAEVPSIKGTVPSMETEAPSIEVEVPSIKAEVPSLEGEFPSLEVSSPKIKSKKKAAGLGSCFGKKAKKREAELDVPQFKGKAELERPNIEVKADVASVEAEIPSKEVQVSAPKITSKGKSAKLGSCFGKKDKKIKANIDNKKVEAEIVQQGLEPEVIVNVPSVEVQTPSAVEISAPKVKSKKKSAGLGSCFGKKDKKFKAQMDVPKIEGKIEVERPDVELGQPLSVEAEVPSVQADVSAPKIKPKKKSANLGSCFGKKNKKIKSQIDTPKIERKVELDSPDIKLGEPLSVEAEIPSAQANVSAPKIKSKKKSANLGSCFGKDKKSKSKTDTPNIDGKIELEKPDIEFREPSSVEVEVPSAQSKVSVPKVKSKKKSANLGSCFGKNKKPVIEVETPKIEGQIELEKPDIEHGEALSVEAELPSVQADVSAPKIKSKKKSANLGSCFGKKNKKIKSQIDTPKIEGEVELDSPDIELGEPLSVEVEVPSAQSKVSLPKIKSKKKSANLGSCFGKNKKPVIEVETPKIEGQIELEKPDIEHGEALSVEAGLPSVQADVSAPKIKPKKKSATLGSCFGKNKKSKPKVDTPRIEGKIELERPDIEFGEPSSVEAEVPIVQADVSAPKVKSKKKSANLGSCFGKNKKPVIEVEKPKIEGQIELEKPDIQHGEALSVEAGLPSVQADVSAPKIKSKKKSANLGSCFGKNKKNKSKIDTPRIEGKVELERPGIEFGERSSVEAEVPTLQADVPTPKIKSKKKSANLGSCFGKDKKNKSRIDTPKIEGKVELERPDIELGESLSVEAKVPSVQADVSAPKIKSKKKSSNLGSCFGKKDKVKAEIEIPKVESESEIDTLKIEGEVNLERPNIQVGESVEVEVPSAQAEVSAPKIKSKKKSANLGTCFGKKNKKIKSQIDTPKIEGKAELDSPDIEVGEPIIVDAEVLPAQAEVRAPKIKSKKKSANLGSCFGKDMKDKSQIDAPKIEEKIELERSNIELEEPLSVEAKVSSAQVEVSAPKIKSKKNSANLGSCFGKKNKKIKSQIDTPKIEGEVKLDSPDIELGEPLSVEAEVPSAQANVLAPKVKSKRKSANLGSCFGKDKKTKSQIDSPKLEGNIELERSDIELEEPLAVEAEVPAVQVSVSAPKVKSKKKSANLGACFGKEKKKKSKIDTPKIEGKVELERPDIELGGPLSVEAEVPSVQVNVSAPKVKSKKTSANLGSCFGKDKKSKTKIDTPKIEGKVELERSDVDFGEPLYVEPEVPSVQADLSAPKMKSKQKSSNLGSCFGKKDKVKAETEIPKVEGESELEQHDIEVNAPAVVIEPISQTRKPQKKTASLGSCFGDRKPRKKSTGVSESVAPKNVDVGNVELNSSGQEIYLDASENIPTTPPLPKPRKRKVKLGSCFGKDTTESGHVKGSSEFKHDIPHGALVTSTPNVNAKKYNIPPEPPKRWYNLNKNKKVDIRPKVEMNQSIPISEDSNVMNFSAESDRSSDIETLINKIFEFDEKHFGSTQPTLKKTVTIKTYKVNTETGETEDLVEEFDVDNLEMTTTRDSLTKKISEMKEMNKDSDPTIKRTVRVKTYKHREGSEEPREIIEDLEIQSNVALKHSFQSNLPEPVNIEASDASEVLMKKLADMNLSNCRPEIRRTVTVKTYTGREDDTTEAGFTIDECTQKTEESVLTKEEVTEFILEKIHEFSDGKIPEASSQAVKEEVSVITEPDKGQFFTVHQNQEEKSHNLSSPYTTANESSMELDSTVDITTESSTILAPKNVEIGVEKKSSLTTSFTSSNSSLNYFENKLNVAKEIVAEFKVDNHDDKNEPIGSSTSSSSGDVVETKKEVVKESDKESGILFSANINPVDGINFETSKNKS